MERAMKVKCSMALVAVAMARWQTLAAPVAWTDFGAGLDGWTAVGDGSISWQSTGGNPGGFLRAVDPASGPNTDAAAPAKFPGDWRAYEGTGTISADATIISGGAVSDGMEFLLAGPGGAAHHRWPTSAGPPHGAWATFSLPIEESAPEVTSGTWSDLLANVTSLRIDLEHVTGTETTGLDNVVLTPEPAAMWLLAFAAPALVRRRRGPLRDRAG
jgi:hypothetical protein